ncbi:MAG TPA: XdhC family protein [Acidisoma sp.]|uniref:XdhC family protein n=1 Tax=Acidisoma sp. TaxID=1872115 RepID=UPI002C021B67|nr:XdhC family protein [Acidisoma sp.]HTI03251.1 XdhC family protein [Acidisoma sp.]
MSPEIAAALAAARAEKRPVVLATRLPDGAQRLLPDGAAPAALAEWAEVLLRTDRSETRDLAGERWFLRPYNPPLRLILVGAVHIAQALVPLAQALGLDPVVVDPRLALATEERFPASHRVTDWPDEALDALGLDARSAVVVLTHDPKLDDPALDRALRSDAFYIGALGSRKSHAARLERLAALGHARESLARIRGPVGLAIGAVTAAEIALSIIAEIVAVLRAAPLGAGR